MKKPRQRSLIRSNSGIATLAEFAMTLFVFFLITLFPLINLMGVATGSMTVMLLARQTASRAAISANYDDACDNVEREAMMFVNSGFGKFAKMKPQGGSNGCGTDVYVNRTEILTGQTKTCGPNKRCPGPIECDKYIYEYSTHSKYSIGPFISLAAVPCLSDVPGVGKPVLIQMHYSMAVENPQGLSGNGTWSNGTGSGGTTPGGTTPGWPIGGNPGGGEPPPTGGGPREMGVFI